MPTTQPEGMGNRLMPKKKKLAVAGAVLQGAAKVGKAYAGEADSDIDMDIDESSNHGNLFNDNETNRYSGPIDS